MNILAIDDNLQSGTSGLHSELEIRESQDLAKEYGGTARSSKGNKALTKKIYKLKKKCLSYLKK